MQRNVNLIGLRVVEDVVQDIAGSVFSLHRAFRNHLGDPVGQRRIVEQITVIVCVQIAQQEGGFSEDEVSVLVAGNHIVFRHRSRAVGRFETEAECFLLQPDSLCDFLSAERHRILIVGIDQDQRIAVVADRCRVVRRRYLLHGVNDLFAVFVLRHACKLAFPDVAVFRGCGGAADGPCRHGFAVCQQPDHHPGRALFADHVSVAFPFFPHRDIDPGGIGENDLRHGFAVFCKYGLRLQRTVPLVLHGHGDGVFRIVKCVLDVRRNIDAGLFLYGIGKGLADVLQGVLDGCEGSDAFGVVFHPFNFALVLLQDKGERSVRDFQVRRIRNLSHGQGHFSVRVVCVGKRRFGNLSARDGSGFAGCVRLGPAVRCGFSDFIGRAVRQPVDLQAFAAHQDDIGLAVCEGHSFRFVGFRTVPVGPCGFEGPCNRFAVLVLHRDRHGEFCFRGHLRGRQDFLADLQRTVPALVQEAVFIRVVAFLVSDGRCQFTFAFLIRHFNGGFNNPVVRNDRRIIRFRVLFDNEAVGSFLIEGNTVKEHHGLVVVRVLRFFIVHRDAFRLVHRVVGFGLQGFARGVPVLVGFIEAESVTEAFRNLSLHHFLRLQGGIAGGSVSIGKYGINVGNGENRSALVFAFLETPAVRDAGFFNFILDACGQIIQFDALACPEGDRHIRGDGETVDAFPEIPCARVAALSHQLLCGKYGFPVRPFRFRLEYVAQYKSVTDLQQAQCAGSGQYVGPV